METGGNRYSTLREVLLFKEETAVLRDAWSTIAGR
jgi:hypothetical protein